MSATTPTLVEVDRLREGMYVHLDLGWTDHPFPFSSFKIRSADQIATIRSLGLRQVRYSPERSDVQPLPAPAPLAAPTRNASAPAAATPTPMPALDAARERRRERLDLQQRSLQRAERAYDEAGRQFKQIVQSARSAPAEAAEAVQALSQSLLGEVAGEREVTIRLLSERAGDEASLHALNVSVLSLLLGRAVGLGAASLRELAIGALLHDMGKLALPGRLRWASDQLTAAERRVVQEHVQHGIDLARQMGLPAGVQTIIGEHHERADGSGYPQRLRGVQLSPGSRVVTLVNHYDNLCNPGNLRQALTPHEALALIFSREKHLFDGPTLSLFVRMMGIYPPGSVMLLNDGRYAISVAVNPSHPRKPHVVIYDGQVPAEQATIVELENEPGLEIEQALKPAALPRAVFEYLSPRKRQSFFFEPTPLG